MASKLPVVGKGQRWIIYGLFLCAAIHCTVSMFCTNYSYLDLSAYEAGSEQLPYQGRVAMMWLFRLADNKSPLIVRAAEKIDVQLRTHHQHSPLIGLTPEKLVSMLAALVSMFGIVWAAVWYGQRRFANLWWLPATLTLSMFYVTYAARYEASLWYPYDVPHYAVFGMACLAVMEGAWWPVLLLFAIDMPIRESAIYLAPVCCAVAWARGEARRGFVLAAAMFALWIPFRIYVTRLYAHNGSETGVHWHRLHDSLTNPVHWPQTASAFAFLLIPLVWGRARLSRAQRYFLGAALLCLFATLGFAVWPETRVFDEWVLPVAVLMTAEVATWVFADESVEVSAGEPVTEADLYAASESSRELAMAGR